MQQPTGLCLVWGELGEREFEQMKPKAKTLQAEMMDSQSRPPASLGSPFSQACGDPEGHATWPACHWMTQGKHCPGSPMLASFPGL